MADTDERILDRFELLAEEGRFQYDSDCVRVMELARIGLSYSGKPNNSADHPERVLDMVAPPPADAALAELADLKERLKDPVSVMTSMMCGIIAKPDFRAFLHIYGEVFNDLEACNIALAEANIELAALRARPQAVPEGFVDAHELLRRIYNTPTRAEKLGGQTFKYVKLCEVIDEIESLSGHRDMHRKAILTCHRQDGTAIGAKRLATC